MRQCIEQSDWPQFLGRFYEFTDSILRSVLLCYEEEGTRRVELQIAVRDSEELNDDGWVCVVLTIDRVTEASIRETKHSTNQVLSQGIHFAMIDEEIAVEFGGAPETPNSFSELKMSDAFVMGRALAFRVTPYVE